MVTSDLTKQPLKAPLTENLLVLWSQPWMESTNTAIKLQRIWLETLNDATRHELDFFSTVTSSCNKLTSCMLGLEGLLTPSSMVSCYHEITGDMTEATLKRARKVSKLSDDLRERIWCEI
ncbi:hypothetical protein HAL1_03507 [Halomonas sp. HAL1]|nr:hypothetical protein HAL1_03507 [Halomonas sp. HAL1]PKG48923.1 hypothetical protein CXF87_14895 [Halomonas sp. MES3-P3E]